MSLAISHWGRAAKLNHIFADDLRRAADEGPDGRVALHSLAAIARSQNLKVVSDPSVAKIQVNAYVETDSETYAMKWVQGHNPFHPETRIELTADVQCLVSIKDDLNRLEAAKTYREWTPEDRRAVELRRELRLHLAATGERTS
jgi:hypothetical protein